MSYFVFVCFCLVATFTPGPAVLLVVKNSAKFGFKKALLGISGNVAAVMTLAILSVIGLSAVILASESAFVIMKLLGGGYLIYLGLNAWRSKNHFVVISSEKKPLVSSRTLFIEAYVTGISNPKALAFYTAVFPQFISLQESAFAQFSLLALTFAICSFVALSAYAWFALLGSKHLAKEVVVTWFHRLTGGLFIGFGSALLLSNRT
ncbi:LysE family translocator [Marinomonas sp. THO17]|uniref:LysE family translocator n=1 Tax=Marinomonas sp. THO17 TaxID=3149048 RepID=UPI00336BCE31